MNLPFGSDFGKRSENRRKSWGTGGGRQARMRRKDKPMQDVLDWCENVFDDAALRNLMRVVMVFFGLAAIMHLLNMLSMSGYRWAEAGILPRVSDIFFAALFLLAVAAIVLRNPWAVPIWLGVSALQVGLFVGIPERFADATSQMMAPQTMVHTHAALFAAFVVLLIIRRFR